MPPKAAASNDLGMVKALTDRLEELDATAAEFQVMVYEGGEELRGAARNAPLRPLALCQMRALGRGDELRNPFTGSGRGYEELQGEVGTAERGAVIATGKYRRARSRSLAVMLYGKSGDGVRAAASEDAGRTGSGGDGAGASAKKYLALCGQQRRAALRLFASTIPMYRKCS